MFLTYKMNFSIHSILAGFIFSVFGVYFVKEAKRTGNLANLIIGIALLGYTFFVDNPYLIWGIGALLLWLGFKIR